MRLRELLIERFSLPFDLVNKLNHTVSNWVNEIKLNTTQFSNIEEVYNQYKRDTKILTNQIRKQIEPTLLQRMALKPIKLDDEIIKPEYFFLDVKVDEKHSEADPDGATYPDWKPFQDKNGHWFLHNILFCKLTRRDYIRLLSSDSQTNQIIETIVEVISHELNHLIQSLSAKDYSSKNNKVEPEIKEFITQDEIDSYAQSFVTYLIQSKQTNIIDLIKQNKLNNLPPRAKELLDKYYNFFMNPPNDITKQEKYKRKVAYQRFLKKIVEKLQDKL